MNIRNGKKRSEQILIIVINAAYSILWFLTESARVISWVSPTLHFFIIAKL